MNGNYPKGSEWRKWDLHVHTPKSIIQEYGGDTDAVWNSFINGLANLPPEIKVIGITDYLFCDGYEYLLTRRNEFPNIDLIIPNIEFRLNTFSGSTNSSQRHNFHVLFDPSVAIADIREQFLNSLSSGYKIQDGSEWQQTPTPRSLQELGKQMKLAAPARNTVHNKSDIQVGFENITYKREDILKQLEKTPFKGKYIVAIGYSEWDQCRWNQSAAEKRTLINTANFCLSCVDDPAKISEHKTDLEKNNLHSFILHSSDAHSLDRLDKTLLWIKADPTFAGLKQVLNEPEARVFIGASPPNYKPDHKVISKITVPTSNGWFCENFEIELTRDLVTIIGGRGSGKSALAEAIAYGAGSRDENEDAFLVKAATYKQSIAGTKIVVSWADGTDTDFVVGKLDEDQGLIRYLPQGVVEKLCSPSKSDVLQMQIENVIFQSLDETEKMGTSDFDDLKSRILANFQYEKDQASKKMREINHRLSSIMTVVRGLPEKQKTLAQKRQELNLLNKTLPSLPPQDKEGQEELAKLTLVKGKFEKKIVEIQSKVSQVGELVMKVKLFANTIKEFEEEIDPLLTNLDIEQRDAFAVRIDNSLITKILDDRRKELINQLEILKTGERKDVSTILAVIEGGLPFDNLSNLSKGIEEKQKQTRAFETTKLKYQQQKKTASDIENTVKALETEIQNIKTVSEPEMKRLALERVELYIAYFDLLKLEKVEIEKLYKPLQDSLFKGTDTDKKLAFAAQISYKVGVHSKAGRDMIDRTRRGNFRESGEMTRTMQNFWQEIYRGDFAKSSITPGLIGILEKFQTFEGEKILVEDQLRDSYTREDFYNWLFDLTPFTIVSSLRFDGTDLYVLSPGQKGIILLMLYLEIDKADYRPLIVDQPEENLDNLSVYRDLIDFFRERKQYRQIIMVTHNPNLVVNTDAEQIVVASYDGKGSPRLSYSSGSLEDQAKKIPDVDVEKFEEGIIEQVCNILEGGEKAFDKRKRKYQISSFMQH